MITTTSIKQGLLRLTTALKTAWDCVRTDFKQHEHSTPFVIVFLARTGSNYLAARLDSHCEIICHHELFNEDGPHRSLSVRDRVSRADIGSKEFRDKNPVAFLKQIFDVDRIVTKEPAKIGAIGFKMSPMENLPVFFALLANRSVKKVVLTRDNILETYVSILLALKTDAWIQFNEETAKTVPRSGQVGVFIDTKKYLRYARKRNAFYAIVNFVRWVTRQIFFKIEYGQIGDDNVTRQLLAFLRTSTDKILTDRTTKQNTLGLSQRIENFEEVRFALRGTMHTKFFGD